MPKSAGYVSSGSSSIDRVLGGFPKGAVTLLLGRPGAGKTLLTLHAASAVTEAKGATAYFDAHASLIPGYLEHLKVAREGRFLQIPATDIDSTLTRTTALIREGFPLVVVDGMEALPATAQSEDGRLASAAQMLTARWPALSKTLARSNTALVITWAAETAPTILGHAANQTLLLQKVQDPDERAFFEVHAHVKKTRLLKAQGKVAVFEVEPDEESKYPVISGVGYNLDMVPEEPEGVSRFDREDIL